MSVGNIKNVGAIIDRPLTLANLLTACYNSANKLKAVIPTSDLELGQQMYAEALEFINRRYPTGWGGCAVMHTEDGQFLISVYLDSFNASAGLCMETGAMCEAQKYNLRITHSLCISRDSEFDEPKILTACGICQERLHYWGEDVKVAVSNPEQKIIFKSLAELDPCYWGNSFPKIEREEYEPGIFLTD